MKITVIEPSGNLYGSEFCLLDIIKGTRGMGMEWEVVMPGGGGFDEVLEREEIVWHPLLPAKLHLLPRWRKMGAYWRLRRHLARARPDVVYLNQAGMLRAVNTLAKGLDLPMVCQVQTLEDARLISGRPVDHAGVQAFLCNSRFTASQASLPVEKRCIFYQPAVLASMAESPAPPEPGEPWRVGILGRIAESKGHPVFLEAARRLVERGHGDLRFVVIGEGISPEVGRRYRDEVEAAGLSGVFEFRGYRKDVPGELARIHVLAIPSVAEPLGRVVLDACVAGVPAVVSDSGGLGEFSRDLEVGWRVPAGDAEALADAVMGILAGYPAAVVRCREEGARMFRRLNPERYFKAMAGILRDAADRKPSAIQWFGEIE